MKIPSLIMICHEFFHYIGLPHQSIDLKQILRKSIISQAKYKFEVRILLFGGPGGALPPRENIKLHEKPINTYKISKKKRARGP